MQRVLICCIFIINILCIQSAYIPKTLKEEAILNAYQKKELVLGLKNTEFDNEVINGESLNSILEDMFSNYLGLNIKVIKGTWKELLEKYNNNEIDILGVMAQTENVKDDVVFTLPLYSDSLYLSSSEFSLKNLDNLNNQNIFTREGSIYNKYLDNFLSNNGINANIIEVDTVYNKKDKIIVTTKYNITSERNKIKIGYLPDKSIALKSNMSDLANIVDNALLEKYQIKIKTFLRNRVRSIYRTNFKNSLTEEENEYLLNNKVITMAFESNRTFSVYSKESNKFIGPVQVVLDKINDRTGLEFRMIKDKNDRWLNAYGNFVGGKADIIPLVENGFVENQILTTPLYYPNLYRVSSFSKKRSKIGVVKDSVEESFAREYYLDKNIILYDTYPELGNALINKKIDDILLFDLNKFDIQNYNIDTFITVPMYLAISNNNVILQSILNKAITQVIDIDKVERDANSLKREEEYNRYKKYLFVNKLIYIALILAVIFLLITLYKNIINKILDKEKRKDDLTGLPNRLEYLALISKRRIFKGYGIQIDIDNFKGINNTFGQKIGDKVLIRVSKILKEVFEKDSIFKVGSDQFFILSEEKDIVKKIDELENEIRNLKICKVTLSMGYYNNNEKSIYIEDIFKYSYMAMEQAKKSEGFSCIEATQEIIKEVERKEKIKSLLRESELDEMFAVFQPKFNIETMEIVGAEALTRWIREDLGFISPAEFIPIAEEIDLISLIDYKVAENSIKFIKELKEKNILKEGFKVAFNLSMKTLEREEVVNKIEFLMEENKIEGKYFEIEVTESIFCSNMKATLEKLNKFKNVGIRLAMDDFTAGHSTVSLLPILPLDVVKFDKGILDGIGTENNLATSNIYTALVHLVKDLKVKIVAEGVETPEQLDFLREVGVDIGQGYLFSKPILKEDFYKILENKKI